LTQTTKTMVRKPKNDLVTIVSLNDLQREQHLLKMRIKEQEQELRKRVQQVPGELFYSGINAVLPTILSGKITSSVINLGKKLVDKAFVKKDGEANNAKLITAAKQAGIYTILKIAYKAFVRSR
jgi:hypothetical protein